MDIPQADFALIGGSSTLNIEIPEVLELDYIEITEKGLVFATPYGTSPEFKVLRIKHQTGDKKVLTCKMHGWRKGVSRGEASRQIFWVFKNAGVRKVFVEGGVGAINHLLRPRDLVIPNDYIDFSMRKDVVLEDKYLLIMREALCPDMRKRLAEVCEKEWKKGRVFDRSVYVNTDGRHFESPAEINLFKIGGGDIVGQSMCPEVYLAREIGACYAGIYIIVNYAEGIIAPWQHDEMADIFYNDGLDLAKIMFAFLRDLPLEQNCNCPELRKDTLLKKIY